MNDRNRPMDDDNNHEDFDKSHNDETVSDVCHYDQVAPTSGKDGARKSVFFPDETSKLTVHIDRRKRRIRKDVAIRDLDENTSADANKSDIHHDHHNGNDYDIESGIVHEIKSINQGSKGHAKIFPKLEPSTSDALAFAIRMAMTMALSSLVVLLPPTIGTEEWPEAAWVYVTAGVVSWQPGPDTSPVFKKLIERIQGTVCGAVLGMALGFLSVAVADAACDEDHSYLRAQALFLGFTLPVVVLVGTFVVTRAGYRGSYVATLTNLTTGLVVLAFFGAEDDAQGRPPWMHGLYRILNILIGCAIAGLVTSLVRPISTHRQISQKIEKLSALTGQSVRAIVDVAVALSRERQFKAVRRAESMESTETNTSKAFLPTITDLVRNPELAISDQAHDSYIASIDSWRDCRQALQLLRFDPIFRSKFNEREQRLFKEHARLRLARLFRIQVVVVVMDSLLRGGLHQGDSSQDALDDLEAIGKRIEALLATDTPDIERDLISRRLIQEDIVRVRARLQRLQTQSLSTIMTSSSTSFSSSDDSTSPGQGELGGDELWSILATFDQPFPLLRLKGNGQTSLFYRLLEHLILKAVRLHHANESFKREMSI